MRLHSNISNNTSFLQTLIILHNLFFFCPMWWPLALRRYCGRELEVDSRHDLDSHSSIHHCRHQVCYPDQILLSGTVLDFCIHRSSSDFFFSMRSIFLPYQARKVSAPRKVFCSGASARRRLITRSMSGTLHTAGLMAWHCRSTGKPCYFCLFLGRRVVSYSSSDIVLLLSFSLAVL